MREKHAVIDVTLLESAPGDDGPTRLVKYLWDNYIELGPATHVFLLGLDIGHSALLPFLTAHGDRVPARVDRVISVVEDSPLHRVYPGLAQWYSRHSLVYVADAHSFWTTEYATKAPRWYGRVRHPPSEEPITGIMAEAIAAERPRPRPPSSPILHRPAKTRPGSDVGRCFDSGVAMECPP